MSLPLEKVGIAGLTGYSGQELQRLLARHSHFKFTRSFGREDTSKTLSPALKSEVDLVFLCTPAETSLDLAPKLLELGIHVVDLSGAFRLQKHGYSEWYGFEHRAPQALARAEFGLYPWKRIEPASASGPTRLVSNPGCFATAALMTLIPLARSGLVRLESLVIDAKSGSTGAGRKAETRLLFSEIYGDFGPYRIGRHQHWPEIVEGVAQYAGAQIAPLFVTELLPVDRGISLACYADWQDRSRTQNLSELRGAFEEAYGQEPDVGLGGDEGALLSMKKVVGTNRVHISVHEAYGRVAIFASIDNLLRGASGQALMNANQLAGLSPHEGLL
jgi:N-acetyl-gamma-glutamyl-phosphate reductase